MSFSCKQTFIGYHLYRYLETQKMPCKGHVSTLNQTPQEHMLLEWRYYKFHKTVRIQNT